MKKYRKPFRVKKKKSIIKSRFFWVFFLILIFVAGIFFLLFFSQFFKIEEIIISGNEKVSQNDIMEVIEKDFLGKKYFFPPANIFLTDFNAIEEDILNKFSNIAAIKIDRDFPATLVLTVTERKAAAIFCQDYNSSKESNNELVVSKCFLCDEEGVIFEEITGDSVNLSKIKNPNLKNELRLGEKVATADLLSKILDIFSGAKNLKILTKEFLIISEERINLKTLEDWEIYFSPQKEISWQLTKLEAVLENIPSDKRKNLEYIELRFGNLAPFKYQEAED
jgi:hypothetical protein